MHTEKEQQVQEQSPTGGQISGHISQNLKFQPSQWFWLTLSQQIQ